MDNFAELSVQPQQHQNSIDQLNEDGYGKVNDSLSLDYATPTTGPETSPQAHIYTSLANPEASSHVYADLVRSREPTSKLPSTSKQRLQVHSTVITQNNQKPTSHQSHYYTSLKDPGAICHEYTDLTTSTNVSPKPTSNSEQHSQDASLMSVSKEKASLSLLSDVYPLVHKHTTTQRQGDVHGGQTAHLSGE